MTREGFKPVGFLHRAPHPVRRLAQRATSSGRDATIAAAQRFAPQHAIIASSAVDSSALFHAVQGGIHAALPSGTSLSKNSSRRFTATRAGIRPWNECRRSAVLRQAMRAARPATVSCVILAQQCGFGLIQPRGIRRKARRAEANFAESRLCSSGAVAPSATLGWPSRAAFPPCAGIAGAARIAVADEWRRAVHPAASTLRL